MRKIGELKRENSNIFLAAIYGLLITGIFGYASLKWFRFINPFEYIQEKHIGEVLLTFPVVIMVFIIHECIHVLFYKLLSKGQAKIKVTRERSVGAVVMHQVNEDVYYSRTQMIIILLAPAILISLMLGVVSVYLNAPYLLWLNAVLNVLGSSVDIYVSIKLLCTRSSRLFVNFHPDKIAMSLYTIQE